MTSQQKQLETMATKLEVNPEANFDDVPNQSMMIGKKTKTLEDSRKVVYPKKDNMKNFFKKHRNDNYHWHKDNNCDKRPNNRFWLPRPR